MEDSGGSLVPESGREREREKEREDDRHWKIAGVR